MALVESFNLLVWEWLTLFGEMIFMIGWRKNSKKYFIICDEDFSENS